MRPGAFEIGAERHQQLLRPPTASGGDLSAAPAATSRSILCTASSAAFQRRSTLAGDKTIRRIDGIVLPAGVSDLVARLLQRQFVLALCRCRFTRLSLDRLHSGVNAERLDDPQDLGADGRVDLQAADRDATFRAWFMRAL